MTKPTSTQASPALIAVWLDRRFRLARLIAERPDDASAWVWQVRHRILTYLLRRYGEAGLVDALLESETLDVELDSDWSGPDRKASRAPGVEPAAGADAPLRGASDFRTNLERLRDLNRPRYAAAAEEREAIEQADALARARSLRFSRSYPEEGFELPDAALMQEQRTLMMQELDALAELMPQDDTLSDEEIVALLSANLQ